MRRVVIGIFLIIFVLLSGCIENKFPEVHTINLKEQHDYPIVNFQGNYIIYSDDGILKTFDINAYNQQFYIMPAKKTYLHYEKYGGLADFHQWTLYINQSDLK